MGYSAQIINYGSGDNPSTSSTFDVNSDQSMDVQTGNFSIGYTYKGQQYTGKTETFTSQLNDGTTVTNSIPESFGLYGLTIIGGSGNSANSSGNLFSYTNREEMSRSGGGITFTQYAQIKNGNGIINFKTTNNTIGTGLEIGNSNLGASLSFGGTGITGFSFSAVGLSIGASGKGITLGFSKEVGSSGEMGLELTISPTKAALSLIPVITYGLERALIFSPL